MKELTSWTDEQFRKMREDMDRLFRDFLSDYAAPTPESQDEGQPRVEVREEEAGVVISLDFSGVDPSGLEIEVSPEMVVIEANRSEQLVEGGRQVHRTRSYSRRIKLPCRIDSELAEAVWLDHHLEIRLPKCTETVFKKITARRRRP